MLHFTESEEFLKLQNQLESFATKQTISQEDLLKYSIKAMQDSYELAVQEHGIKICDCGAENKISFSFCTSCGSKLNK